MKLSFNLKLFKIYQNVFSVCWGGVMGVPMLKSILVLGIVSKTKIQRET